MSVMLKVLLIAFSLILFSIVLNLISKNKMPVKYSLFWIMTSIVIFVVGAFPNFSTTFTKFIGFKTPSNLVIGIILALLLLITMILTIIVSYQKKQIKLLVQEVSLMKGEKNEK